MPRLVYRPKHPQADEFGMVDVSVAGPRHETGQACNVIRDEMDVTRHMADGRYYTSKAKFREATRAAGCIEVGNETATVLKPRKQVALSREQRRDDIRRAVRQLQGY